jgi:hypothetical protein
MVKNLSISSSLKSEAMIFQIKINNVRYFKIVELEIMLTIKIELVYFFKTL